MSAARTFAADGVPVDLRDLRGEDLDPLLDSQAEQWRREFRWDFAPTRASIRRFLDARALFGYALVESGEAVGYCYFIQEDEKALVGDVYLRPERRSAAAESALLDATLRAAAVYPGVRRVEGQSLALSFDLTDFPLFARAVRATPRLFMAIEGLPERDLPGRSPTPGVAYAPWDEDDVEPAAALIAEAYAGHVDATINDQYRSPEGARRFLFNMTDHTGCGVFLRRASTTARRGVFRALAGVCLAGRVDADAGHITQLCVAPAERGRGVGREMLRRTLDMLAGHGCEVASLTVTESNAGAIALYRGLGFETWRRFYAFVWEGV